MDQSPHHPNLTGEWKRRIYEAIFHQRPLKSQKGLIGMCELEPNRRAPAGVGSRPSDFATYKK